MAGSIESCCRRALGIEVDRAGSRAGSKMRRSACGLLRRRASRKCPREVIRPERAPIDELRVDAARLVPPTGEELRSWARSKRIFVSGIMDLTAERGEAIAAIEPCGAQPVVWELITPSPVPPEEAWLDAFAPPTRSC